jgi:hypothetical protein
MEEPASGSEGFWGTPPAKAVALHARASSTIETVFISSGTVSMSGTNLSEVVASPLRTGGLSVLALGRVAGMNARIVNGSDSSGDSRGGAKRGWD